MIGGAYHIFNFTERNNILYEGYLNNLITIDQAVRVSSYMKITPYESLSEFGITLIGKYTDDDIEEEIELTDTPVTTSNKFTYLDSVECDDLNELSTIPYIKIETVDENDLPVYVTEHALYYGRYNIVTSRQSAIDIFNRGQEFRDIIYCVLDGEVKVQRGQTFRIAGQPNEYVIITSPRYKFRLGTTAIESTEFYAGMNYDAPRVV